MRSLRTPTTTSSHGTSPDTTARALIPQHEVSLLPRHHHHPHAGGFLCGRQATRADSSASPNPSEHGPLLSTLMMRTAFLSSWHIRLRLDGAHSCGGLSSRPALMLSYEATSPRDWLCPCARLPLHWPGSSVSRHGSRVDGPLSGVSCFRGGCHQLPAHFGMPVVANR
jgi:hypothetical protein